MFSTRSAFKWTHHGHFLKTDLDNVARTYVKIHLFSLLAGDSGECRALTRSSLPVTHIHLGPVSETIQWTTLMPKGNSSRLLLFHLP